MSSPFNINSSSDKGLSYAIGGMRANTFRCGYLSAKLFVYADDVLRDISDLTITERKGTNANTARFVARGGWEPVGGEGLIILQGTRNRIGRMFGGTILAPNATNLVGKPEHRYVSAQVADWTWALNGDLVMGRFTGTYDDIAIELMERYAPSGFSTNKVQRGLGTVSNGIEFTDVYLSVALERLAKRGGITQFITYQQELYFRTDGLRLSRPATVTADRVTLKAFSYRRDYGQLVTRVYFECKGSVTLEEIASGESIVPLLDVSNFPLTGGLAKSGTQRFAFAGVVLGGGGSVVGPGAQPSSPPALALASGSGVDAGLHLLAYVFVTVDGKTLPSPTASITTGSVPAPSSAVTAGTPTSGGSMDGGSHRYYPVFRTAAGSTTAGPVSNSVTAVAPQAAPTLSGYAVSRVAGGSLDSGANYRWKHAYQRNSDGAFTTAGPASASQAMGAGELTGVINITDLGIAAPSGFTLVWFRTEGDGSTYKRVTSFSYGPHPVLGGSDTYFIDGSADETLGAVEPATNETGKGTCAITNIPVSADSLVTHVDLYREFNGAGAATAKLAKSVTNGTTSATDTTANSGLGATVPSSNTAAAGRIDATVPAGPDGVTDIELYMTPLGSSQLKKVTSVGSNTASTITVSTADSALGIDAPTEDDSGLSQPDGVVLPGATECPVSSPADFEDAGGWAVVGNGQRAFRFTGKSGNELTGIPPSGAGAVAAPIPYNSQITQAPQLTGVTSGSPDSGSITYTIPKGQDVTPVVQVDNTDAQALLRSKVPGHSGIKAVPLSNRALSYTEATARAQAYLDVRSEVPATASVRTKDINFGINRVAELNLEAPTSVADELMVQSVTITNFHKKPPVDPATERPADYQPDRIVEAASELISVEDLLRQDART